MPQNPGNYIPAPHPVVEEKTRLITRPWMMFWQSIVDGLINAGNIFGPSSSTDNQIVLFDGATGKLLKGATGTGFVFATSGIYSVVTLDELIDEVGSGFAQLHGLQRAVGDGATTAFDLLDVAEYLEHIGVGGSFQDPATFSLSADHSQIIFDTAPAADAVIAIEYVTATI